MIVSIREKNQEDFQEYGCNFKLQPNFFLKYNFIGLLLIILSSNTYLLAQSDNDTKMHNMVMKSEYLDTINFYFLIGDTSNVLELIKNEEMVDFRSKQGFLIAYNINNKLYDYLKYDNTYSIGNLLELATSSNTGFYKIYLDNKELFDKKISSILNYNQKKVASFYITDQSIRNKNFFYNLIKENKIIYDGFLLNDADFLNINLSNLTDIFSFYKSTNKFLELEELGEELFNFQIVLFAHETEKERRNFYLKLIKDAVKSGYINIETEMNFILRTEMIEKGTNKFFEDYEKRIEEIRKEYNKPDYNFSVI